MNYTVEKNRLNKALNKRATGRDGVHITHQQRAREPKQNFPVSLKFQPASPVFIFNC